MSDINIDTFSLEDIEDPFFEMDQESISSSNNYSQSGGSNTEVNDEEESTNLNEVVSINSNEEESTNSNEEESLSLIHI